MTRKRVRSEAVCLWLRPDELALIRDRMAEAGIRNMSAYLRKMALNGYVLNVDLAPVKEMVSLQRRCANNLNQVAVQANTYGGIYPQELARLQKDYEALWGPRADLVAMLSAIVKVQDCSGERLRAVPRLSRLLATVARRSQRWGQP